MPGEAAASPGACPVLGKGGLNADGLEGGVGWGVGGDLQPPTV